MKLSRHSVAFDGIPRSYLLALPASAASTPPLALVVLIHGFKGNATFTIDRWAHLADRNLAVVAPEGYEKSWNARVCCGAALHKNLDDVGFISHLVRHVWAQTPGLAQYKSKAFLVGISNGGFLTQLVTLSAVRGAPGFEFLAGSVSVAAVQWESGLYPSDAEARVQVPTLLLHGLNDTAVRFDGCCPSQARPCCCDISKHAPEPCTSTREIYNRWRRINKCAHGDAQAPHAQRQQVSAGVCVTSEQGCTPTHLCTYPTAGHALITDVPSVAATTADFIEAQVCRVLDCVKPPQAASDGQQQRPSLPQSSGVPNVLVMAMILCGLCLWGLRRRQGQQARAGRMP
jgi:poly(3-hydroxybutyrate) depolymerase